MKWLFRGFILGAILCLVYIFMPRTHQSIMQAKVKDYKRVVSLAPSMSETMQALNQHHRLVGVTIHCQGHNFDNVQKIGSFAEPDFEAIMALQPDLVLAVPHVMAMPTLERLKEHNIEIFMYQPDSLNDIKDIVAKLAHIFSVSELGTQVNWQIDTALSQGYEEVSTIPDHELSKTALVVISSMPFVVAGKKTFPSEIIERLGFLNQAQNDLVPWPIWSIENFMTSPPTLLILTHEEQGPYFKRLAMGLHAHKDHTHIIVPKRPLFNSPSPVIIDDIHHLTALVLSKL